MLFTQEKQANLRVCDGCDLRCKLGISVETKQEAKNATRSANGVLSLLAPYRYTCKKCGMVQSHSDNVQTCAKNIMSGKCRDEFVRQTVGVTLFPEHYSNQKQR